MPGFLLPVPPNPASQLAPGRAEQCIGLPRPWQQHFGLDRDVANRSFRKIIWLDLFRHIVCLRQLRLIGVLDCLSKKRVLPLGRPRLAVLRRSKYVSPKRLGIADFGRHRRWWHRAQKFFQHLAGVHYRPFARSWSFKLDYRCQACSSSCLPRSSSSQVASGRPKRSSDWRLRASAPS